MTDITELLDHLTDAAKWRDEILKYFQGFSGRPIVAR